MNNFDTTETCFILNYGPHYRSELFKKINSELNADIFVGDKLTENIKPINYSKFPKVFIIKNKVLLNRFLWQKKSISIALRKSYKNIILTGDGAILSNIVIALISIFTRKKVFLWTHGIKFNLNWKGKLLNYTLFYLSNKIFVYSNYSKSIMVSNGFSSNKIICIYNSMGGKIDAIEKNSKLKIFDNDYPIILYLGRIQVIKKVDLILEAMYLLKQDNINCNLLLIGPNTDNLNLDKHARSLNLSDNIHFYGDLYEEELISKILNSVNILVSPGNIGLSVIHCFRHGIPAITHNNFSMQMPEFEAIIPNITGDFFEENDVIDLKNKINKWLILTKTNSEEILRNTREIVNTFYNSDNQIEIFKNHIN